MNICKTAGIRYFTDDEVDKNSFGVDNGIEHMHFRTLSMLDAVRHRLGRPLKGTCFYRSKEWDLAKGRSGNSDHCIGQGVDLEIGSLAEAAEIIAAASLEGFNRFGINMDKKFVHIGWRIQDHISKWNY